MIYVTHDQVEAMTLADKIVVLRDGRIEQVGSPLELYHHPRNQFVAGFIGSPTMNFREMTVKSVGAEGVTVEFPGAAGMTLPFQPNSISAGQRLIVGVRPEHLKPAASGAIGGEVTAVERLGGLTFLYVQVTPQTLVVVQAEGNSAARVDDRVAIAVDPALCHFFWRRRQCDRTASAPANGRLKRAFNECVRLS